MMHAQLHVAALLPKCVMQADRLAHVLHAAALPWLRLSPRRRYLSGGAASSEPCTHAENLSPLLIS